MTTPISCGTDGWRGVIADDYTFDNVRRCAQGFASYIRSLGKGDAWLVVGHDKRFASEHFAAAAASVLAANGLRVWLTDGATPTPIISYSVVARRSDGAINITASHNPPTDNGFKVRDSRGAALDPDELKKVESMIPADPGGVKQIDYADAESQGLVKKFDPAPAYVEHLHDLIDLEPLKRAGIKLVADPMWGNGAGWFPRLLEGGQTEVVEIHNTRNPIFPEMKRPEPIQPNVDVGLATTTHVGAAVDIITDGDADRLGVGDEHGQFIDQLRVYALLALYLLEVRGQRGAIVKTLSTTSMLDKLGRLYNVPVYTTGVGFKYVAPKMLETDALIGGEESGGYAFRGNVPERDGILAGLYILDMMVRLEKKPSELVEFLFSKVGPHYYERIDRNFPQEQRRQIQQRIADAHPAEIAGLKVEQVITTDGFKFVLEDQDWLLIRFSGTEPIMRFYTETTRQDKVQPILQAGIQLAGLKE